MDVLAPETIWIEGRCYRVNDCLQELSSFSECDLYEENVVCEEMDEEMDNSIEKTGPEKFSTSFHVPRHYFGYIIGAKGSTRRRIETETRTAVKIPRMGQNGDVVITGSTYQNVAKAKRRVNLIISGARQKQVPTHFLSIPLNTESIIKNFNMFKELALSENSQNVEESLFVTAEKLHLTLGMLCLMDDEERLAASEALCEAKTKIIEPLLMENEIRITLKGISYMNDDPHSVDVLYGEVMEEDENNVNLQTLADRLIAFFIEKDFMKKERGNRVKLHMTLLKSKYPDESENDTSASNKKARMKRQSFDASKILENYKNFEFGDHVVTEIHVSQRFTERQDGYYQPTCIISL